MSPVSPPKDTWVIVPPCRVLTETWGAAGVPVGGSRPRRRRHQVGGRLQGAGGRLELYGEPIDPVEQGGRGVIGSL